MLHRSARSEFIHRARTWQIAVSGSAGHGHGGNRKSCLLCRRSMRRELAVRAQLIARIRTCIIELGGEDAKILFCVQRRHGGPYERYLCRWYGGLYRPDGHPSRMWIADEMNELAGQTMKECTRSLPVAAYLPNRDIQPLAEPRARKRAIYAASIFCCGSQPDHRRAGTGTADQGECGLPWRPAYVPVRAARDAFDDGAGV